LVEVIGKGNLVEPSSFLGEVAVGVVEAVGIGGNALAEGRKAVRMSASVRTWPSNQ